MKIKNTILKIICADILTLEVDAVVCPANIEGQLEGILKAGESVIMPLTDAKSKNMIHTVTVNSDMTTDEHIIRRSIASAFEVADENEVESIAIPALGCVVGNFPVLASAKILSQEILKVTRFTSTKLKEIILCLPDQQTFEIFEQSVTGYVTHIQDNLGNGPYITTDCIIELPEGIIIIERSNPPFGWALPGGFVDVGESLEEAVCREAKEETNMELEDLRQMHTYSDPSRDPRFHTVTTVFIAKGIGTPQFGDDAKGLKIVAYDDLLKGQYAFDHKNVIQDYLSQR